jgi:hypothetical protein
MVAVPGECPSGYARCQRRAHPVTTCSVALATYWQLRFPFTHAEPAALHHARCTWHDSQE